MKKALLILLILLPLVTFSQVSTNPSIPTTSGEITINFDATGTELEGYTGQVYAHTGVTADGDQWQNVIGDWDDDANNPKVTRDTNNANKYSLLITPDVYSYYNVDTTKEITEISIVFRSEDASKQSRPDYFIQIFKQGDLNITFTTPENNDVFNLNDNITISAEASTSADLELFINNSSVKTETATTTISHPYTFTSAGLHTFKTTATTTETKETEISVYVKTATESKPKPSGLKYGLNKNSDNSVTFVLQAPLKTDIFIIGEFNNWKLDTAYQMYQDPTSKDFWLTVTSLDINTEYAYQYYIDYDITVADPYSEKILDPGNDKYIPEETYPNIKTYPTGLTTGIVSTFQIKEDEYTWSTTNFVKPNQDNLIVYELLIRDFTIVNTNDIGDFKTAITKLDYLQSLGINAIELMPINEFEGNDSWGYNPSFHNALDKAYGSKNDFKAFVDECHKRGIAIILDIVYNHAFGQSPLAQMYWDSTNNSPASDNPWLNVTPTHPYNVGNDFNHESDNTKTYVKQTVNHWINEFKIDGFRFDLSKGFTQTNNPNNVDAWGQYDASRIAILKDYANDIWANSTNDVYLILEHFATNSEERELSDHGFLLWGNSNHNYNQNTMGYSTDSSIDWMSYVERNWSSPKVMGYMESHDEERLMYKNLNSGKSNTDYNVKDLNTALSREETAGMFLFTIPGPKMIWQFGELGYDISIDENGRTGRKPVKWEYEENLNRKHIYNTWATLIAFKTKYPDVFNTTTFDLSVGNTLTKSIVLKDASMDVVIIGNFDIVSKDISVNFTKTGDWFEYFSGEIKPITNVSQSITLKPGEYKMYSSVKLLDPRGGTSADDSDNDGVKDTDDLCPNTMEGVTVGSTGCPSVELPTTNFEIEIIGETCTGKNNGQIIIESQETHNYVTTEINGETYSFTKDKTISNLPADTYTFCISVDGTNYQQCFTAVVEEGETVLAKATVKASKVAIDIEKGTAPYNVSINGKNIYTTNETTFEIDASHGDLIEVTTNIICEGKFSKKMDLISEIKSYPNPTTGQFEIALPIDKKEVTIEIYNLQSQLISSKSYPVNYGKVQVNIADKPKGLYIAKVILDSPIALKIIKK